MSSTTVVASSRAGTSRAGIGPYAVAGGVVALAVAAYAVSKNYEVVREGRLLPWPGHVAEIRFFGTFTLFVNQERTRPLDVMDTTLLAMLAGTLFFALRLLRRAAAGSPRERAFLALGLVGALWLVADESLALHETIGDNLRFLARVPGAHRPDDVIFASYVVPAAAFAIVFRRLMLATRTATLLFGAAAALFVLAGLFDVAGIGADELAEPLSSACLLAGFTHVALGILRAGGVIRAPAAAGG
jgi:hypothetical protein